MAHLGLGRYCAVGGVLGGVLFESSAMLGLGCAIGRKGKFFGQMKLLCFDHFVTLGCVERAVCVSSLLTSPSRRDVTREGTAEHVSQLCWALHRPITWPGSSE